MSGGYVYANPLAQHSNIRCGRNPPRATATGADITAS
ncbi:hypothetical protein BBNG_00137 [Bifidobacterium bifidum NCIMB 41171]|nr:hypothetical protein BBNG_00137 [Bifidobacterium bifidum NCIMB 41171]